MADIQQLERALINADAAGDEAAARQLAAAITQMRQQAPQAPQQAPQAPASAEQQRLASVPGRMIQGARDPIDAMAQLLPRGLQAVTSLGGMANNRVSDFFGSEAKRVDSLNAENERAYQEARQASQQAGTDWARIGGNVVSPANLAIASRLPAAATTLGKIGAGALGGGLSGALSTPVQEGKDFASEKLKQAAIGAVGGGILPAVTAGIGRLISPNAASNANLQMLKAEGVRPTIGQALGGRFGALEEKLQSIPITGDMISKSRGRALDQYNQAVINRTVQPIGETVKGTGQNAIQEAGNKISAAYEAGKTALGSFQLDRQAATELVKLKQMASQLPPKEQQAFNQAWDLLDGEVSKNGSMVAEGFKRFDSKIGLEARRFGASQDAYQQQAADALKELQRIVLDAGKRANPKAAEMLSKADEAWAQLVRLEGAGKAAKNAEGLFTPAQLNQAVQAADQSTRKRAVARGTALMQDLANAGQSVLGNKVPNSGTADRLWLGAGALGGGAALSPAVPAGLLGGAAMYTEPMQRMLLAAASSRPQSAKAVRGLLDQAAPMLGPAGGLLGLNYANQ